MIKCTNCGRENDDSFRFCLDCGTELKPATAAPAPAAPAARPPTAAPAARPPTAAPAPRPPTAAPAPPPPAAAAESKCPKCGQPQRPNDAFCAHCGQAQGAAAPRSTMFMHVASPEAVTKPRARLVLIKPDGSEGTVFNLSDKTTIGRTAGVIMFPKDAYISPRHTELHFQDGLLTVIDLASLNGVYRKMTAEEPIVPGAYFRIGRQLLRLEVPGDFQALAGDRPSGDDSQYWGSPVPHVWARLVQVLEGGKIGEIHLLTQAEVIIGREDGEVRFPEDGFVSSRHCQLSNRDGDCFIRDLGSSNGTYLRIHQSHTLSDGDRIQIGNQVLRVDIS